MNQDTAQAIVEAAIRYAEVRDQVDKIKMPQREPQSYGALFDALIAADDNLRVQVRYYNRVLRHQAAVAQRKANRIAQTPGDAVSPGV